MKGVRFTAKVTHSCNLIWFTAIHQKQGQWFVWSAKEYSLTLWWLSWMPLSYLSYLKLSVTAAKWISFYYFYIRLYLFIFILFLILLMYCCYLTHIKTVLEFCLFLILFIWLILKWLNFIFNSMYFFLILFICYFTYIKAFVQFFY